MLYISVHVYGASLSGLAILAAFALVYVQLPGLLLLKAASLRPKYMSTTLALGFFSGWIIELCVYFLADWLRSEVLLYAAGPALAILYLISSIIDGRRGLQKRIRINRIPVLFCIFLVLILFYCIINTQYIYLSPTISELTYMNPDKAYHMGLINSLSHDYPLESPWIKGVFINYHIFSEILMSIPVRLFDLSADLLTLSFGPFLTAYCFGISLYSFFREMSAKPNRAGIYCMIVLLSNLYVTRNTTSSLAFKFILINDNSAGYGMAAALMTIVIFRMWYDAFTSKASNRYRLLVLLTLFVMLTAGIKGPMGAVAVAGMWGTMILGMLLRKVSPKALPALITITAGFVLIYVTVLGSKGQSNASGNSLYIRRENALQDAALSRKPSVQQVGGNDKQERRQKNPEKKALPGAKHRGPRDKASADQEIEPHPRRREHIGEKGPVGDGAVRKNRDGPDMHQNHQKTGQDSEKLYPGILPFCCFSRITHHSNHSLSQKQSSIRNQNSESCRDPSFPLR